MKVLVLFSFLLVFYYAKMDLDELPRFVRVPPNFAILRIPAEEGNFSLIKPLVARKISVAFPNLPWAILHWPKPGYWSKIARNEPVTGGTIDPYATPPPHVEAILYSSGLFQTRSLCFRVCNTNVCHDHGFFWFGY